MVAVRQQGVIHFDLFPCVGGMLLLHFAGAPWAEWDEWDESKRRKNIRDHGIDFLGREAMWDSFTITREDVPARSITITVTTYPKKRVVWSMIDRATGAGCAMCALPRERR